MLIQTGKSLELKNYSVEEKIGFREINFLVHAISSSMALLQELVLTYMF